MFRRQLTLLAEADGVQGTFCPLHYWLSPSVTREKFTLRSSLDHIIPGITPAATSGGPRTLHIGTPEEVLAAYGSDLYYCTSSVIRELAANHLHHFDLTPESRQSISLCFRGFCIATSCSDDSARDMLRRTTLALGGEFVSPDSDHLTHFVTDIPIFPDYILNQIDELFLVTFAWVQQSFEQQKVLPVDAFRLKPFSNLFFTSSDLDPDEAHHLKKIVVAGGGVWCNSYDDSISFVVTHRLAMTPKIRLALSASVPIVKPAWLLAQQRNFANPANFLLNFWCWQDRRSQLFEGFSFAIHIDCEDRDLVIETITANSGSFGQEPDFFVVPHFYESPDGHYVTPTWVWSSVTEQRVLPVTDSRVYSPFAVRKICLKGYVVALCKLRESDRFELAEGLRAFGVAVHFRISELAKVAVADSQDCDLKTQAARFRVPLVKISWVLELLEKGVAPNVEAFLLDGRSGLNIRNLCSEIQQRSASIQQLGQKTGVRRVDSRSLATFSDDEDVDTKPSPRIKVGYREPVMAPQIPLADRDGACDPLLDLL
jgi:hypothetical protein